MTWDSENNVWRGSQTYYLIVSDRQYPETNDSVRKWVAPTAGTSNLGSGNNLSVKNKQLNVKSVMAGYSAMTDFT